MASDVAAILNGYFCGGPVPAALYIGLVRATNFNAYDHTNDSMASHPGWEEFTSYSETSRQLWVPGVVVDGPAAASANNPSTAIITPTSAERIVGVFLTDDPTIGGNTGQLYGPWDDEAGARDTFIGSPFKIDLSIYLKPNTPQVS